MAGACNVHRHVEEQPETQVARATSYDHQILRPSRSVDDKAVLAALVIEIKAGSRESMTAHVRVPGAIVRTWWREQATIGGQVLGFWSRYAVEHACGVGFVMRGLDLRRSDIKLSQGLLGLRIWTQQ